VPVEPPGCAAGDDRAAQLVSVTRPLADITVRPAEQIEVAVSFLVSFMLVYLRRWPAVTAR
jgi:hypothetical protein